MNLRHLAYRIALTGAQGTGKSTLARVLLGRFRESGVDDVDALVGVGATVGATGHAVGSTATAATVRLFAAEHLAREHAAAAQVQLFDRCMLDALAYARVLDVLPRDELAELHRTTAASMAACAMVVWMRVSADYPVVTERDESPEFRRAIDAAIGECSRELGVALIEHAVPPDTIDAIADVALGCYLAHATPGAFGR